MLKINSTLLIMWILLLCISGLSSGAKWDYSGSIGPIFWPGTCKSGSRQSPIDLSDAISDKDLTEVQLTNYEIPPWKMELSNNGHSVKLTIQTGSDSVPTLGPRGGFGNDTYLFAQMHFHWGSEFSGKGSEHTLGGKSYPMELHLVHVNNKYNGDISVAINEPDGLAVLGVFLKLNDSTRDNFALNGIDEGLNLIRNPGDKKALSLPFPLQSLLPDAGQGGFFRYAGSLTTPPCSESVTWTVFKKPVSISESQLKKFRNIKNEFGDPMVDNFRPIYPVKDRILREFNPKNAESSYDLYEERPEEIDHFFLLIMSIIIFFMQCGFAFMEAGAVRSKNTVNILIKNWLDMCIGALAYWAVGFAFTFGKSAGPNLGKFVGSSYFFFYDMPYYKLSKWFFQFVFAATAATLVSGSLAERCNFVAYVVYSIMITGFIYPILAHWTWHREGWLRINGFYDFAGSGVVHLTGAVCALVGCVLMGPRCGRFDKDGKPIAMPGHSVPLSALGGLILVFGFFACNGTKQGSISHPGDGTAIARAIVNTALGTSSAGIFTLIFYKLGIVPGTGANYSFLVTMNGSLTGTVALCAGCNAFPCWAAVIVGGLSGPLFVVFEWLMIHLKIDDPLAAIPVHGVGGVWGLISVYLFKDDGIIMTGSTEAWIGLSWNLIGMLAIVSWTFGTCFIMFYTLKQVKMLRVEAAYEFKGMDILKHGESAYPADAWVEQQYMQEDNQESEDLSGAKAIIEDHEKPSRKKSTKGLPPNMRFSRQASYNNPHEMFPSASKLFGGMNNIAGTVSNATKKDLNTIGENGSIEEKTKLRE